MNMDSDSDFAVQLACQAGELLLAHFEQSRRLHTSLKADHSLVTEADLAADRLISRAIQERFPEDVLLSEELAPSYNPHGNSPAVWIVDPLDGTTNFSLGLPLWGILITRLQEGYPFQTVHHFPKLHETYTAQRGRGAFLNGEPIRVEPPDPQHTTPFFTCCSRTYRRYQVSVPYKPRILGSSAYNFCCVARGIALLGFEAAPKIWDIAGGWLLVQEAGGFVETYDGSQPFPLRTEVPYASQNFPTLAGATAELLAQAHNQIKPKSGG